MTNAFQAFVEGRLFTLLGTAYPGLDIRAAGQEPSQAATAVVVQVLASDESYPTHLGRAAKSRNVGIVQVDVYFPPDQGDGPGTALAEDAAALFTRLDAPVAGEGRVRFKDGTVSPRGEMNGKRKVRARIPYEYDYTPRVAQA